MQKHILSNYREVSLAQESIPFTSKSTEPVCSQVLTVALQNQKLPV